MIDSSIEGHYDNKNVHSSTNFGIWLFLEITDCSATNVPHLPNPPLRTNFRERNHE